MRNWILNIVLCNIMMRNVLFYSILFCSILFSKDVELRIKTLFYLYMFFFYHKYYLNVGESLFVDTLHYIDRCIIFWCVNTYWVDLMFTGFS